MSAPQTNRLPFARSLRFWATRPLLLNASLFALTWLLYGDLRLQGQGEFYFYRTDDFWLQRTGAEPFDTHPGLENVLLPGVATLAGHALEVIGLQLTDDRFAVIAAIPYVLFIYGLSTYVARRRGFGPVVSCATALALYTSGLVPYMTTWGGYPDGLTYLLMLPIFVWPDSFAVYAVVILLQCLNHYLGAVALVVWACLRYAWKALDAAAPRTNPAISTRSWLAAGATRALFGLAVLVVFQLAWQASYPQAASVRASIVAAKWENPGTVVREVLEWFPFTIGSTFKLVLVSLACLVVLSRQRRATRAIVLAAPFIIGSLLTLLFVDVTRILTITAMPVTFVLLDSLRAGSTLAPNDRRRLRRVFLVTAALNLLVPNYYVNNGSVVVPHSALIVGGLDALFTRD